jgi:thioredoxin-related protein
MKHIYPIVILLLVGINCKNKDAGQASTTGLKWLTVSEASELVQKGGNEKKFLVDVYTDWCGWCKFMDKKTFADPSVVEYLNENFNVVKFNAEQKEAVVYKGKTYNWEPMGRNGINALGIELLQGRLSYPSLVYLDKNLNPITVSPGYKKPEELIQELKSL